MPVGNNLPTPFDDIVAVDAGITVAGATRATGVLGNDTDPDLGETALLVVSAIITGTSGSPIAVADGSPTLVHGTYGDLSIYADGTYSYTADTAAARELAQGQPGVDLFTYTVVDPESAFATATLTFDVTGQDDAPVITAGSSGSVTENASFGGSYAAPELIPAGNADGLPDALPGSDQRVPYSGGLSNPGRSASDPAVTTYAELFPGVAGGPISQSVITLAGGHYIIEVQDGAGADTTGFTVEWNGAVVTPSHSTTSDDGAGYTDTFYDVVAASGNSTVTLLVTNAPTGNLDFLSVTPAPGIEMISGTISFTDADALEPHTASYTPQADFYLGSFTLTFPQDASSGATGIMAWNFQIADDDLHFLAPGQVVKQFYDVMISDSAYPAFGDTYTVEIDLMACYCTGTRILTDRGEVPVEALSVGDIVVTAAGEERPVHWIGYRDLDLCAFRGRGEAFLPVRVMAGAFGGGRPYRDLWLSPEHAVFVDDVLIPIRHLVNGTTIAPVEVDCVTYWHVELDSHDVLLAEGLPAESYLDNGNRTAFVNGGDYLDLYPDFEPRSWSETCAPLLREGPIVAGVKARLIDRAQRLGHRLTGDSDLHLVADGSIIRPAALIGNRYRFDLAKNAKTLRLASRRWVPAELEPESEDRRDLGVCVMALSADGVEVPLDSLEGGGWHDVERDQGVDRRWTTGSATLPITGARHITVDVCGAGLYWDIVPAGLAVAETAEFG